MGACFSLCDRGFHPSDWGFFWDLVQKGILIDMENLHLYFLMEDKGVWSGPHDASMFPFFIGNVFLRSEPSILSNKFDFSFRKLLYLFLYFCNAYL